MLPCDRARAWSRGSLVPSLLLLLHVALPEAGAAQELPRVGFGEVDVTPSLETGRPVWMAGHEHNLRATGIHDLLYARAVVLSDGARKIALVAVDSIGVQYPSVERVRQQLGDFAYCLVASTHTHEGPDAIGLWGPSPTESGVDPEYLKQLEAGVVAAVRKAEAGLAPARAEYATAEDQSLLADYRLPEVFDSVLRAVRFVDPQTGRTRGIVVQWNSHPVEPDNNTLLSRDFMGVTVATLEARHQAPVVYFSGAVGGLMGTPNNLFRDDGGKPRAKDVFDYIRLYGEAVADLADRALKQAQSVELLPLAVWARSVAVPMTNPGYRAARKLGVLSRAAYEWTGDWRQLGPAIAAEEVEGAQAVRSEVACLRLGELHIAAIPGELYPELVYGAFPRQPAEGVDFPDAPLEQGITQAMPAAKPLFLGLANDELGYIIPKRQWDTEPPFAYGRQSPQYGERNSLGPDAAAVLLDALGASVRGLPNPASEK